MKVFDAYSLYYDLLYKDKNYQGEADYIASLLGTVQNVFEMGCGTGKHASLLMQKGYSVFAIDNSQSMLNQAKMLGVDCQLGDVRTFDCKRIFDSVISLFHVASYQNSDSDVEQYFATAQKHLNGGRFIFDVWHKDAVLAQLPEKRIKKMENDEIVVTRFCEPCHLIEKNIVEVNYHIEIVSKITGEKQCLNECHSMRYFSFDDIEKFATRTGFKILKSYEWLTSNKPSKNSWGVCYICEGNK